MKKLLQRMVASLFFLNLTACALVNTYNIDPNAPHAKLGVQSGTGENPIIVFKDYQLCKGMQTIPLYGLPVEINAEHPTTILVHHVFGYDQTLFFPITFTPRENHTYLAQVSSKTVDQNIQFTFQLIDATSGKGVPTPFAERKIDLTAFSYHCTDVNDISKNKIFSIKKESPATQLIL